MSIHNIRFHGEVRKISVFFGWIKIWNDNTPLLSCHGEITLSKIDQMYPAIPNQISIKINAHKYYQVWWKSIEIYSSYHPQMKIWLSHGQITLSNSHKICTFETKIWTYCWEVKSWWNLPITNPKQISTISMHMPILVKIHWYLLKLLSRNKKSDMPRADSSVKNWRMFFSICNP